MSELQWWQRGVFYQIYPRSFADGNGDGIGDLAGMTERLDYLADLGIDAIWLSPHYPSPLFDCGYDVADYVSVAPEYGTLDDFQRFLDAAHHRNIRVILDLVLNHTSDQHPWFKEARSSRDNPRRDWYVWHPGRNGGPPNNWLATFGGSAWEFDPASGEYYYHFFFKEQPDLNWRNPEVKQAMWNAVRFWLDRGIDGFRMDAIETIFEDPALPDTEGLLTEADLFRAMTAATGDKDAATLFDERERMFRHQLAQPGLHELMQDLRLLVNQYPGRVLVGETEELAYCGNGENELHMVFNFPLMKTGKLTPAWVRANQEHRLAELPAAGWPCNTLGNHDTSRVYTHFGDGEHDDAWARISLALMLTLRGTPFLYNGEEIGMADHLGLAPEQFKDMLGVWYHRVARDVLELDPAEALRQANRFGRDKCRTPMQWSAAGNAGFSANGAAPWLPVHPNYGKGTNVADQQADPGSLLNFYRRMLHLRRQTPALVEGAYLALGQVDPADECLAFMRTSASQTCLVLLNMGPAGHIIDLAAAVARADLDPRPDVDPSAGLVFSSRPRPAALDLRSVDVAPFEVLIAQLK